MILGLRVKQNSEDLPDVSQDVLVNALISYDVGLKFLKLELLRIFVKDVL